MLGYSATHTIQPHQCGRNSVACPHFADAHCPIPTCGRPSRAPNQLHPLYFRCSAPSRMARPACAQT
eukprot:363531-Chlamydomonas_euryale.AAC.4